MNELSMPMGREIRLVIHINSSADLLVRKNESGLSITGVFLKRFNDFVRLSIFPANISESEFAEFIFIQTQIKESEFWYRPDLKVIIPTIPLIYQNKNNYLTQLDIPILQKDSPATYFNQTCQ